MSISIDQSPSNPLVESITEPLIKKNQSVPNTTK